jgi:hypothetical protein
MTADLDFAAPRAAQNPGSRHRRHRSRDRRRTDRSTWSRHRRHSDRLGHPRHRVYLGPPASAPSEGGGIQFEAGYVPIIQQVQIQTRPVTAKLWKHRASASTRMRPSRAKGASAIGAAQAHLWPGAAHRSDQHIGCVPPGWKPTYGQFGCDASGDLDWANSVSATF